VRTYLFIAVLAVFAPSLVSNFVLAEPPPVSATCSISCTVADIAEWSENSFPVINLPDLTTQNSQVSGSASLVLYTNGDVKITADNSDAAQLSKDALSKLATEYKLEYDAAGVGQTGGNTVTWTDYDSFLSKGSTVNHIPADGAVEVILSVRASYDSKAPPSLGDYTSTQTLTVCWKS